MCVVCTGRAIDVNIPYGGRQHCIAFTINEKVKIFWNTLKIEKYIENQKYVDYLANRYIYMYATKMAVGSNNKIK